MTFLPHRLNRQPVVVRADRRRVVDLRRPVRCAGFALGLPLAWLTHSIAMVPTLIVAGIALASSSAAVPCARRSAAGPDTWLYRQPSGGWPCGTRRWRRSWAGSASSPVRATGPPGATPIEPPMSRFKNEVAQPAGAREDAASGAGALFVVALLLGFGWWSAPKVSPSTCRRICARAARASGGTCRLRVYAFTFYIWQQAALAHERRRGLPAQPARAVGLPGRRAAGPSATGLQYRRASGELRQRVRGIYEIPGRGYGDDPAMRVRWFPDRDWIVTLDVSADDTTA